MARLLNGILGRGAGKISGIVMSHWKGISYARAYAVPANPNTDPQKAQRSKIRIGVALGKYLVGQIFKPYWNKFARDMSGYNAWIKENINYFTDPITLSNIKMALGQLWGVPTLAVTAADLSIDCTWTPGDYGNNGAATDKVYAFAYDPTNKLYRFAAAPVLRSAGTISVVMLPVSDSVDCTVWVFASKYSLTSPTLLELVSESSNGHVVVNTP